MAVDSAEYTVEWLRAVWYYARSILKNSNILAKIKPNSKYFNPLPSGQGRLELWKKTVRKSCLTVPLKRILKRHLTLCSIVLRGTWHCAELDSAQYDTALSLTLRSICRYCAELRKNLNISAKTKRNLKTF